MVILNSIFSYIFSLEIPSKTFISLHFALFCINFFKQNFNSNIDKNNNLCELMI